LNLIKIGLGSEVTKTTDITQYGQCFDLIIEDSTTIYIICQSCYQSFSLLIKEYLPNSEEEEDPPIVELEIPLQFQDVDKAKIDDEFIFLLGNSTQTSSISDISIYQLINQKSQISHIADFSSLFPAFTSFTIQEFDIQLIHSTIVSNGMSSLYAVFLIYSENLYYTEIILTTFDNGTTTAEPNQLLPIPIQTLFTSAYESGSLQYISIDSFEFDQIPSMDFTNYTFSVLLGTSFNIYSVNITWNSLYFDPQITPKTIYKGYSGCTNYYNEKLKSLDVLMASLCYQVNQNKSLGPIGGKIFTLLIYHEQYNNVSSRSHEINNQKVNVYFPITMISRQIVENASSFALYDSEGFVNEERNHHVILSNSLLQFEDFVIFDEIELIKNPNLLSENLDEHTILNLTAVNKFSQQTYTIIAQNNPNKSKEPYLIEVYLAVFGISVLVIFSYLIIRCCKKSKLFKRTRKYEISDDDDDNYYMIMKSKNLMMHNNS